MICCLVFSQISFDAHKEILIPTEARLNLIGDFNNDSSNEIVIASGYYFNDTADYHLYIFRPDKNSDFELVQKIPYPKIYPGLTSLEKGDFNNDGLMDVVLTYSDSIAIFYQNTHNKIDTNYLTRFAGEMSHGVAAGDINGDQLDDIIVGNWRENFIKIFYQNLHGNFTEASVYKITSGNNVIKIKDINNDGLNDVILTNGWIFSGGIDLFSFCIYIQDSTTNLLQEPIVYDIENADFNFMDGIDIDDVNNDGLMDIVTTQNLQLFVWYQKRENLNYYDQTPVELNTYYNPGPVEIFDLNLDGKKEIICVNSGWNTVSVYESDSVYQYSDYRLFDAWNSSNLYQQGLSVGYINNDSLPDISVAFWAGGHFGGVSNIINTSKIDSISFVDLNTFSVAMKIYPNPGSESFRIYTSKILYFPITVTVNNYLGQMIYEATFQNELQEINLKHNDDGMYFIHISDSNNKKYCKKIIFKRG